MLERVFHSIGKSAVELKKEMEAIHDDIRLSIALLQEADQLIATRLELYRVYNGSYVSTPNVQTVEIRSLMHSRVEAAAALAHNDVKFVAEMNSNFVGDLFVRLDMYMFCHIANNVRLVPSVASTAHCDAQLLSNARKHTFNGSVRLRFLKEEDDQLHFAVLDSGRGIPKPIANRLFKEEVCSADVRGVGLGLVSSARPTDRVANEPLPQVSCKKFAEAIKGSVRLFELWQFPSSENAQVWLETTRVCSVEDSTGGTEFRFCLPGKIVRVEENSATCESTTIRGTRVVTPVVGVTLPTHMKVYVVEDSELRRTTTNQSD